MPLFAALAFTLLMAALSVALTPASPLWSPVGGSWLVDGLSGAGFAGLALVVLAFLGRASVKAVLGGFIGALAGAVLARLALPLFPTLAGALPPLLGLAMVYVGAAAGALQAQRFQLHRLREAWSGAEPPSAPKIIDTSVIIDGRIHDVMEAGFLDGRILIPQFVLSELQQVADSSDALKRARGRKGLELLQSMKNLPHVQVEITQDNFPAIPEVDLKLIELARRSGGKLVTNDYNLNRVARVRDIDVLNINDLANALKPVVLPGEPMRVFVLKEGKEAGQGVAYLDDGTMVVVDDGRDHVGHNVSIVVTSVLQTTAGKMFFGRLAPAESDAGLEEPKR